MGLGWGPQIARGCNPPVNDKYCPEDMVSRGQMAAFLVRALNLTGRLDDPFTDDDGSVFEASIEKLAAAGVTRGCNPPANHLFCPNDPVTRGQMAALLVRAMGYADSGEGDLFADDDGSVFEANIDKLGTAGVTRGCNPPVNDMFCPDAPVLCDQMASFLTRALGLTPRSSCFATASSCHRFHRWMRPPLRRRLLLRRHCRPWMTWLGTALSGRAMWDVYR